METTEHMGAPWGAHGPPWGPIGAPRAPWGPHGPHGAPMGTMEPVACMSCGARDPPGLLFSQKMLFRPKNGILTLDLAKGGAGAT